MTRRYYRYRNCGWVASLMWKHEREMASETALNEAARAWFSWNNIRIKWHVGN